VTANNLKIAGSLAMASAFLTLPLAYLSFRLENGVYLYADEIQTFIQASGTLLFVTIVLYLKRFLNSIFAFHDTDKNIGLMILGSMVTGVLAISLYSFPALKESLGSALIVLLVLLGIVQAQFGYKLLKLPNELGGLLRPFCYANMATGILLATVVLIPLSIPLSALSDLMLGTIFFNMSKLMKEQQRIEGTN
jgi:uncharacterized protein YejL (UPF0352 family)